MIEAVVMIVCLYSFFALYFCCQCLGYGDYADEHSGKILRLKELCSVIEVKREKVLIFTQFRAIIPSLSSYLGTVFQKAGLILHGNVKIKERQELVNLFQTENELPFFVLFLKAGRTGLNLTSTVHVIL
jgi:SNF2 family DNA or RNA helicase